MTKENPEAKPPQDKYIELIQGKNKKINEMIAEEKARKAEIEAIKNKIKNLPLPKKS